MSRHVLLVTPHLFGTFAGPDLTSTRPLISYSCSERNAGAGVSDVYQLWTDPHAALCSGSDDYFVIKLRTRDTDAAKKEKVSEGMVCVILSSTPS